MGTHARMAVGALLISGAMLFGPASSAAADPSVDSTNNVDVVHSGPPSLGPLRSLTAPPRLNVPNLSELRQMQSLRLQMVMDRRSKIYSTLSNIMKKVSDSAASVVGNIK